MTQIDENFRGKYRSLRRDERGGVMVWFAGSLTMVMGFAALAVDVGHLYSLRGNMQNAADAAALAAVTQMPDANNVESVALDITEKNLPSATHGTVLDSSDIEIGQWDRAAKTFTPGANPPSAVRVTMRRTSSSGNPVPTMFTGALGLSEMDIVVSAIAAPPNTASCLVALEPTEKESLMLNSNSEIQANGCAIQVNSANAEAIRTNSNSDMIAEEINVTGGYVGSGYSPTPTTGAAAVSDPLAGLTAPAEASDPCDYDDVTFNASTVTLSPGVYCKKLEINSNTDATLLPGIYVIRDGHFIVNSNSSITGDGVMLYFTGTNKPGLILNSNSDADLSAPTSGPYAGILIYQDPNVEDGTQILLNSNGDSIFEGTVYVPNAEIVINSNSVISGPAAYTHLIARNFTINSNSGIVLNSDYSSGPPLPAGLGGSNTALVQ